MNLSKSRYPVDASEPMCQTCESPLGNHSTTCPGAYGVSVEYTNRRGDRYFVFEGKTKTGKPKYFCARKTSAAGLPIDTLPSGYEIHESPESMQVSVRKIRPSRISQFERELIIRLAGELSEAPSIVEVQGDSLVIFASDTRPDNRAEVLTKLFGGTLSDQADISDWIASNMRYSPMLRFTLTDEDKRLYSAERWCFLGSIDKFMPLEFDKPLEHLARKLLKHLGQESFFELM